MAGTRPFWAGIAARGQTLSLLCALGVSAAAEGAGVGSVRGNFSPPAYERAEQLGIVEGSEDWVFLEGGQAPQ